MWRPSMSLKGKKSKSSAVKTPTSTKRKRKTSVSDDEEAKTPKIPKDLPPMSKIYNRSFRNNKPAELFRKDLISAMKMPDSDQLIPEDYWTMNDPWKEEWERGVQVPVNPEILPEPRVRIIRLENNEDFKLPKKFLHNAQDDNFNGELHIISAASTVADKACRYDLDDVDTQWLQLLNQERDDLGLPPIEEVTMEIVMEELESQCFANLQDVIKSQEGLGIEYDEDVICDVCRSPDSEDGNEMVFCDSCNICVHQACYGITSIPEGSWVCRTCALGIKPSCELCPNKGGAMKSTKSGSKWAHVSCALWVPEVSIGCVEKMEPITKISQIPPSRWSLICVICKDRTGSCIQCSVKTCKTAYHVTCAFQHGLEMKAIIDEDNEDEGVKLRSYCEKHSKKLEKYSSESEQEEKRDKKLLSPITKTDRRPPIRRELEMTTEDKAGAREKRIDHVKSEFSKHVSAKQVAESLQIERLVVDFIFQYWKLKRKSNFDKPLLTPKAEESDELCRQQEDSLYARMKMFVHLRQDLERVRNLCYMVSRREKISRSLFKVREEVFKKQVAMLSKKNSKLTEKERSAIIQANHGDSIYDRLYSCDSERFPLPSAIVSILEGKESPPQDIQCLKRFVKRPDKVTITPGSSGSHHSDKSHSHSNSKSQSSQPNPYAKHYFNGVRRSHRRFTSLFSDDEVQGSNVKMDESFLDDVKSESSYAESKTEGSGRLKWEDDDSNTCSAKYEEFDMGTTGAASSSSAKDINDNPKVLQTKKLNNTILEEETKLLNELKATMNEVLSHVGGKENDEKPYFLPTLESNSSLTPNNNNNSVMDDEIECPHLTSPMDDGETSSRELNEDQTTRDILDCDDISVTSMRKLRSGRSRLAENNTGSESDEIKSEKNSTVNATGTPSSKESTAKLDKITPLDNTNNLKKKKKSFKTSTVSTDSSPNSKKDLPRPKIFPRTCLVGYRIPKKKSESDLENTAKKDVRGNSPLSPLSGIKTDLAPLYNQKPVRHISVSQPQNSLHSIPPLQPPPPPPPQLTNHWSQVHENLNNSPRLVIKLRKDPDSPRWRSDAFNHLESSSPEMSFRVIQNDWRNEGSRSGTNDRSRRSGSNERYSPNNGNRYPMRFRNSSQQKQSKSAEMAS